MRIAHLVLALALGMAPGTALWAAPAQAQIVRADDFVTVEMRGLRSEFEAERRAALARFERNPGAYHPLLILSAVQALAALGRTPDALRWMYVAEIRHRTDVNIEEREGVAAGALAEIVGQFENEQWGDARARVAAIGPARRRALLEEARQIEARLPRGYARGAEGLVGAPAGAPWPGESAIAIARFSAVAATHARLEEQSAREAQIAAADAAIAAGAVPEEAAALAPQGVRAIPIRSQRLALSCPAVRALIAAPAGAPSAFVLVCANQGRQSGDEGALSALWLASADLSEIGAARALPFFRAERLVVRDGASFLPLVEGTGAQRVLTLIDAQGRAHSMTLPSAAGGLGRYTAFSPSGRYLLSKSAGALEVFDLAANASIFTRPRAPGESDEYVQIFEDARGAPVLAGRRTIVEGASSSARLFAIDVIAGRERVVAVSNEARAARVHPYGPTQLAAPVATPAAALGEQTGSDSWRPARLGPSVTLFDLATLEPVWSGAPEAAPAPRGPPECGRRAFAAPLAGDLVLSAHGAVARLPAGPRGLPAQCAVSSDGARLLIVAPPFLHLYELTAP